MKTSYLFLAQGFEEIEALATTDILRRAGVPVKTVSITDTYEVTGANGVTVKADMLIDNVDESEALFLICPGGMPGATNLAACGKLTSMLKAHNAAGEPIAAICASPAVVLAPLGILNGHKATCYPGMEPITLTEAEMTGEPVVQSGNLITANGPANTFAFALAIAAKAEGAQKAGEVAAGLLYKV